MTYCFVVSFSCSYTLESTATCEMGSVIFKKDRGAIIVLVVVVVVVVYGQ